MPVPYLNLLQSLRQRTALSAVQWQSRRDLNLRGSGQGGGAEGEGVAADEDAVVREVAL